MVRGVKDEQVRGKDVRRRVADPRQVLELIDDVRALGPIPDASVRRDPHEIKHEHPHRQSGEQDENRELEPVDPG